MQAAFVTDIPENINKVYSHETQEKLKGMFDFYDCIITKNQIEKLKDAECVFTTWGFPSYTEEQIQNFFPKLKIIFYGAGSVQYFAEPFLKKGVKIVSAWRANSIPVIEYSISQIVLANKGFFRLSVMKNCSESKKYFKTFPGNYNVKIGLIGLGAIGSGVAEKLKDYNFEVLAYDPYASAEKAKQLNVRLTDLKEIFSVCQTISNHCANLPETVGLLNYDLFSKMLENATFINTGRGAQVVEEDLVRALNEQPNRTAVLDVTFPEPPKEDSSLYTLPNVFLTPHIAGSAGNECERMGDYMLEEAMCFLQNKQLNHEVSLNMLKTMA